MYFQFICVSLIFIFFQIGHVTYKNLKVDVANAKIFDVNEKGLVSTYNRYGFSYIQVDSIEDSDMSQTTHFPLQVCVLLSCFPLKK